MLPLDSTRPLSPAVTRTRQVACGTHHTLALSENSEVFAWGAGKCNQQRRPTCPPPRHPPNVTRLAGEYGKLGLGDEEKHTSPVLVEELQVIACSIDLRT